MSSQLFKYKYSYNQGCQYQDPRQNVYAHPEAYAGSSFNNRQNQPIYQAATIDVNPVISIENYSAKMAREVIRKGFVRKVLGILIAQLMIAALAIALTFINKGNTRKWMKGHRWALYVALGVSLGTLILMACFRKLSRRVPWNYLLLTLYTLALAYFLAYVAAVSRSTIVLFAEGFTLFAVLVIAFYAWRTKKDLTHKRSGILSVISALLMILIFGLIFKSHIINIVIGAIFSAACSSLFACNVQKLSGKYEAQCSLDDYVVAALDFSIEIVVLLLRSVILKK